MTITYTGVCVCLSSVWFVLLAESNTNKYKHAEVSLTNTKSEQSLAIRCPFLNFFLLILISVSPSLIHHPLYPLISVCWVSLPSFSVPDIQKQHCCICCVCLQSQCHITGFPWALQVPGELPVGLAALPQPQPRLSGNKNIEKLFLPGLFWDSAAQKQSKQWKNMSSMAIYEPCMWVIVQR